MVTEPLGATGLCPEPAQCRSLFPPIFGEGKLIFGEGKLKLREQLAQGHTAGEW